MIIDRTPKPERNEEITREWVKGKSCADLGRKYGLTRERIRTIVASTLDYEPKKRRRSAAKSIFPVLEALMGNEGVTYRELAEKIKVSENTVRNKLSAERPFLLREAIAVKQVLNSDLPLEKLFAREDAPE